MQDAVSKLIGGLEAEIPGLMAREGIPGMSIAIIVDGAVRWVRGFGVTDRLRRLPVTPDTMFSLQSCSKTFTATAVMLAVQEGLLDLDLPVAAYLPDFTVSSRFDEHPERIITMRHLLSHRAGFTHEAPVGNNYERDTHCSSFEAHIASIGRTWLRFPVGQRYAYSNLGIDLAGYALQTVSGMPFAEYVRQKLFVPLGMTRSSFDYEAVRVVHDRAVGHDVFVEAAGGDVPLVVPMIPAGGLYASVHDVARFIGCHINKGLVEGRVLLAPKYSEGIVSIPWPLPGQSAGYALGVATDMQRRTRRCFHGGGGFGFLSDMIWYPELGLGIAVLTNSSNHRLQWRYANQVLDRLLQLPEYAGRIPRADEPAEPTVQVDRAIRPSERFVGHYVGRMPDAVHVQRHGGGLGIRYLRSRKPLPLFFSATDQAFVRSGGSITRYRFETDDDGAPARLACLDNGTVYDYNHGPHDRPGPNIREWRSYTGTYLARGLGWTPFMARVRRRNGHLYLHLQVSASGLALKLNEHASGLFFTSSGEAVEFQEDAFVFGGVTFVRIGPGTQARQWMLLAKGSLGLWLGRARGGLAWRFGKRRAQAGRSTDRTVTIR